MGGSYSVAYGINSFSEIVGSAQDPFGADRAFFWENQKMNQLTALPSSSWSTARAINDMAQAICWVGYDGGQTSSYLWDQGDVFDLGGFGGDETWAYGINDMGHSVGWSEDVDGTYQAFVHDGSEMFNLGTLGGLFSAAYGINNDGVIAGRAQDVDGYTHAVKWVLVPEPSTLLALTLGALILHNKKKIVRNNCKG